MDFEGLEEVVAYEGKQFVINMDGPITTNDNAFELCEHFVTDGAKLYAVMSRYEDLVSRTRRNQKSKVGSKVAAGASFPQGLWSERLQDA